jgi:hypothetical protein
MLYNSMLHSRALRFMRSLNDSINSFLYISPFLIEKEKYVILIYIRIYIFIFTFAKIGIIFVYFDIFCIKFISSCSKFVRKYSTK